MDYETEGNELRARFDTQWADATLVQWDNAPKDGEPDFNPPADAAWVRFSVRSGESSQVSLGASKRIRHVGLILIDIFVPLGSGDKLLREHADTIRGYFDGWKSAGGIQCRYGSLSIIGRDQSWWHGQIDIPYWWDETT